MNNYISGSSPHVIFAKWLAWGDIQTPQGEIKLNIAKLKENLKVFFPMFLDVQSDLTCVEYHLKLPFANRAGDSFQNGLAKNRS